MADNSPIGIFDSGIGGLSVWKEIVRLMPNESVVYYGDGKNCPYGPKSDAEIIGISDEIVRLLIEKKVKTIVVACNTATAAAIDYLRRNYPIPFIGMEPAVKPAARESESGVIGILATATTLEGRLFRETSRRFSSSVRIVSCVGEGLVEIIENDCEETPEAFEAVRKCVEPMLEQGADHLVLGCTHYPFLEGAIRRAIGERKVALVDPAPAIAHRIREVLKENGLQAEEGNRAHYTYFTSAGSEYLAGLARRAGAILQKLNVEGRNENL